MMQRSICTYPIYYVIFAHDCSDDEESVSKIVMELVDGEVVIGECELFPNELPATTRTSLNFTNTNRNDLPKIFVSKQESRELTIDEYQQYETNSTIAAVSATDIDEARSGLHSPSIGSIVNAEASDDGSFVNLSDSADSLPWSSVHSGLSSTFGSGAASAVTKVSVGLLELEIVAAANIPPSRLMLNVGGPQSPFVVLGFGRKSFRTKTISRNNNPVWKEQLYLPINEHEMGYFLTFSLYNQRAFAGNVCTGKAKLKVNELMQRPSQKFKLSLPIQVDPEDVNQEKPCNLLVKCSFVPIDQVKNQFWATICKQFQQEPSETRTRLNLVEFESMMNIIGPDLSDPTLDSIAEGLGPYAEDGEYSFQTIAASLALLTITSDTTQVTDGATLIIAQCPICAKPMDSGTSSDDIIGHIYICSSRDSTGQVNKEMMGGFLTEEQASRKWLTRVFSSLSFGGYELGKDNGNIFVHERTSGKLIEEKMPTYVRLGIRMIYQKSGKAADAQMVRRLLQSMTIKQGIKFSSPDSAKNIKSFIKFHQLNLDEVHDPVESFQSFNEFFYRRLKPDVRPAASTDPNVSLCPADCRLITYPTVDEATRLWIKGTNFSVSEMLKDPQLGEFFDGGSLAVCRLAPQDYHRFHCPFEATVNMIYHIPGAYFTVNPMAIRRSFDVLTENARTVVILNSPVFGKVAYIAVGAMMVGSIIMTCEQGDHLNALEEIGYFAFGGSTIVLVFPKDSNEFDQDLLVHSSECLETLVRVGQTLGHHPSTM